MESRHYLLFLLRCITTFFEYEMNIPFNKIVSELKNMEWMIKRISKIREIETCSLYSAYLEDAI